MATGSLKTDRRLLLRQLALVVLVVILGLHPVPGAFALERRAVFLGDVWIFHPVGNRRAALGNVHRRVVDVLLAGGTRLAARIVRTEPRSEAQRLLGAAEVLMEPARA